MADENYAIRVSFDGIDKAIADFLRLQTAVANIKAPVFNLGGDDASKIAIASLKKLQLEIDALEAKKASSAAKDLQRADQLAAKQQSNGQRLLAQLEKQDAVAQRRLTQGNLNGNNAEQKEAIRRAKLYEEEIRLKQQLNQIKNTAFSPEDRAKAEAFANAISKINVQKIEKEFGQVNVGTRNFIGNLQDASAQLQVLAGKLNEIKGNASAAFIELDTARKKLSTISDDANGLVKALANVGKENANQATTAQLAAAAYEVQSAGFSKTADTAKILDASLKGSVGGFSDVTTVSKATISVLNAYGLSADQAAATVDKFTAVQQSGLITVDQYASQISRVAPVAAAAGVSLDQLNGFIATATASGVPVEATFSGLRQALASTIKPSSDATKEAERLGIQFDATALRTKGLNGILADVKNSGKATGDTFSKLFGSIEAVAAIQPAINDLGKLETNIKASSESAGLAEKNFDKAKSTLKGFANEAQNALATLGERINNTAIFNPLVGGARLLVSAFQAIPEPAQNVIALIVGLGASFVGLSAVITGTLAVTTPTIAAFKILTKAIIEKTAADVASVPSATASATATAAQGTAAGAAAVGVNSFTAAVKASLVALAPFAAIAGVAFGAFKVGELILQERQLREFNDTLDASSKSTQQLGNQTFALAEKLRALREARAKGGGDTAKESGTLNIVKQQIAELEAQRKAVDDAASKTLNTDEGKTQKQAFLNTSKDLQIQINALTNESKKLEEAQKKTFSSVFTKQIAVNTEELKKQAVALKEAQNQDKERAAKRGFDDAKTKRDIENAKAIAAIEEQNALKKGELDRKQQLETDALKERQQSALQEKQRTFDDAQNAKKLQREEAIAALQRANQQKLDDQKEARAEKQRKDEEKFAAARAERDKKNADALSGAKQLISNEGAIATASPEDRAKIAAQLAEEERIRALAATQGSGGEQTQEQLVAKAKQIAQVQAIATLEEQKKVQFALQALDEANKKKQAELDKAEDLARSEAKRAADKEFEAQQNAEKLAFEQTVLKPEKLKLEKELQADKLAFESGELAALKKQQLAEERALKLQQETEDLARKKAADAEIEALKQQQKADELAKDRAFEDAKIERERAFKEEQRALDKASAIEIQQILGRSAQQIIDAIAVAKGGTSLSGAIGVGKIPQFADGVTNFVGGAALVGERGAELVTLPRGSNVIPANQTSQILNNSGGNKTFNFNISNAGDPMEAAFSVQNEIRRIEALNSGV